MGLGTLGTVFAAREVWQVAREGTQKAAATLPDVRGIDKVKGFVSRHPALATFVVVALGAQLLGGSLPAVAGVLGMRGRKS